MGIKKLGLQDGLQEMSWPQNIMAVQDLIERFSSMDPSWGWSGLGLLLNILYMNKPKAMCPLPK